MGTYQLSIRAKFIFRLRLMHYIGNGYLTTLVWVIVPRFFNFEELSIQIFRLPSPGQTPIQSPSVWRSGHSPEYQLLV